MFNRLSWFLAYRYLNSKFTNGFVSFITVIATIGVALGTAVLIIVLSVLNGFKTHIESRLLQDQPHLITEYHDATNSPAVIEKVAKLAKDLDVNSKQIPLIKDNGLIKIKDKIMRVVIVSFYNNQKIGDFETNRSIHSNKKDGVAVSRGLAQYLNLHLQDKIILASPILKNSIMGPQPRFKRYTVNHIYDNNIGLVAAKEAQIIMPYQEALTFFDTDSNYISGIYTYLDRPLMAENLKHAITKNSDLNQILASKVKISTWYDFNRTLFQAIKIERVAIVFLLLIITAVAGFNLVSGLYIQVSEKQKDMAILRTYGLNPKQVGSIFIMQGMIIGLVGGIFGVLLGIAVSYNLDYIFNLLINFKIINTDNLFFTAIADKYIKIAPNYFDVIVIFGCALVICILATILP